MKKVYIKTFGCQMNEYDSDKMADVLHHHDGMVKTDTPEDADLILLNTWSMAFATDGIKSLLTLIEVDKRAEIWLLSNSS